MDMQSGTRQSVLKRCLLFLLCLVASSCAVVRAQELTTPQLLQKRDQWKQWVQEERKVQLTGRYKGRAADRLQLQKLGISFVPEKGINIPGRAVRPGTRVSLSGYFVKDGRRPEFRVTRLTVESSDHDQMLEQLRAIPEGQSQARYDIADRYEAVAGFFGDNQLQAAVARCRAETFAAERIEYRQDAELLWKLAEPGPSFAVDDAVRQHIRFEVFVLKSRQVVDAALLESIREYLPGWDAVGLTATPEQLEGIQQDRVAAYGQANDELRRVMDRLLYREVRLKDLQGGIESNGSNALEVAETVSKELPEEVQAIAVMKSTWADYRIQNVEALRRRELDQVVGLLNEIERDEDGRRSVNAWLKVQEERFRREGYKGQSRLADEFLHAGMRWKRQDCRERGVGYLKQAWETAGREAPEAVADIEQRLKNLGFTRLHERWMTDDEVKNLPKDDAELALKEGRVVEGMVLPQVRAIMGAPTRRMRLVSAQHVEEVWVYGERHASRIVFRLRRQPTQPDDAAVVIERLQVAGI